MKHLHTFFVVILFTTTISAQQWQHYLDGTNITALANDGNFLWVGTSAGVVKLDSIVQKFCDWYQFYIYTSI